MPDDEKQIRTLIEQWAAAVNHGDIDGVLAGHTGDIVMFDVPPPHDGVRGIGAYRESWPPFFEWLAQGASFEILSLDVTAGDTVAFAVALLRCGMPQADGPGAPLRLSLGLRKEDGRWLVAHEHHSFAAIDGADDGADDGARDRRAAEREVRAVHQGWFDGTAAKDLDGIMAHIAGDVVSYEHDGPLQVTGIGDVREACRRGLDASSGAVGWDVPHLQVLVRDDIAVAWGLNRMQAEQPGGEHTESWSRGSRVFQRRDGEWLMIHQHVSFPFDPETGRASTDLRP